MYLRFHIKTNVLEDKRSFERVIKRFDGNKNYFKQCGILKMIFRKEQNCVSLINMENSPAHHRYRQIPAQVLPGFVSCPQKA